MDKRKQKNEINTYYYKNRHGDKNDKTVGTFKD